jgi:outer membrane protein assembly factor BamB
MLRGAVCCVLACLCAGSLTQAAHGEPAWSTYHHDAGRSGLDPEAGSPLTPTLTWHSTDLGAPIWGQPLVVGSRVYVATVGDWLYALDSATGAVLWRSSAGTPVPSGRLPCGDITPTVGIVGTPVIDIAAGTIYAVADTWNPTTAEAHHVLKGYNLSNGAEVLSTPVDPPGANPKTLLQRTALNLDGGRVVFGFGGNDGDCGTYLGTVVAAPEAGGAPAYWQVPIKVKSKSGGAVWGTSGPAVDGEGHIVASTGNPNPAGERATVYDYSDSVVELDPNLNLLGSFEPPSWEQDSNNDTDLGSAGPELLPGGLVFQAGKNGTGYLIAESSMPAHAAAVYSHQVCGGHGSFGGDAFAGGVIYVPCTNGVQALAYDQAARTFTPLWQGPGDANGPPILSAGLVWVVATGGGGGTKLYGLNPSTGVARYTETLPSPVADHFASPSAGGGRLFVATGSSVAAYVIAQPAIGTSPPPTSTPPATPIVTVSPEATLVGTSLTVGASGRFTVKIRCPVGVGTCTGTITLRSLRAVIAGARAVGQRVRTRAAILTLATGSFAVAGGHVKVITLRLLPRARRLLRRTHPLRARATLIARDDAGTRRVSHATVVLHLARRRGRSH